MTDPESTSEPLATSGMVAGLLAAELKGGADIPITGFSGLREANPGDITFIRDEQHAPDWETSKASVALVTRGIEIENQDPARALIYVECADAAVATLLEAVRQQTQPPPPPAGVHPNAIVADSATIDPTASVGPAAVIEDGVTIGPGAVVSPNATIRRGATIGEGTRIYPSAVIGLNARIGARCNIYSGAVIAAEGFGYYRNAQGVNVLFPHLATVTMGDDCDIGANCTIDRGKFTDTVIGNGVKMDNLSHIGHACRVGDHTVICGGSSIGGSVTIGARVTIGGAVSVRDNLSICDDARIGGGSGVGKDIKKPGDYWGYPAGPGARMVKAFAAVARLPETRDRLTELERRVDQMSDSE